MAENLNEYENEDIVTLTSEEGEQIEFYHEATIEYKEEKYVFLHPVVEIPEIGEDEIIIFKIVEGEKEDEDTLEPVEDDKILDAVYEEYIKLIEESEEK